MNLNIVRSRLRWGINEERARQLEDGDRKTGVGECGNV